MPDAVAAVRDVDASVVLILLVALTSVAFGCRYLFASRYMAYHAQLTGWDWPDIPARLQAVILGMLKIVGVGMLCFGLSLAWLTIPFSRGDEWATWAIVSLVSVNGAVSSYVTFTLRRVDPLAKTNVWFAVGGVVVAAIAVALDRL